MAYLFTPIRAVTIAKYRFMLNVEPVYESVFAKCLNEVVWLAKGRVTLSVRTKMVLD